MHSQLKTIWLQRKLWEIHFTTVFNSILRTIGKIKSLLGLSKSSSRGSWKICRKRLNKSMKNWSLQSQFQNNLLKWVVKFKKPPLILKTTNSTAQLKLKTYLKTRRPSLSANDSSWTTSFQMTLLTETSKIRIS